MRTLYLSFLLLLPTLGLAQQTNLYFPPLSGSWESLSPDSLGWCSARLDSLSAFVENQDTKAFIILKDGKIVVEWYYDSFTQDSLWYWASAGKTVTAALVGLAQSEGFIDIDSSSSTYLGQGWTLCDSLSEAKITPRHQLSMSTGLDEQFASNIDCTDDTCLSCLTTPGTRWYYHNAPYTLLTEVVENTTNRPINTYFMQKIGLRIGAVGGYISTLEAYNRVFVSRARDMARFGLLMLNEGNWDGQLILPDTAYTRASMRPSQALNQSYGYLWWLNGQPQYRLPGTTLSFNGDLIPNAPKDMVAALGKNDQKLYLVPSEGLVVVRMGQAAGPPLLSLSTFDNELWGQIQDLACTQTTSIEVPAASNIRIIPNPSNTYIRAEADLPILSLTLRSLDGQDIKRTDENYMRLSGIAAGLYLVELIDESGRTFHQKLLIP